MRDKLAELDRKITDFSYKRENAIQQLYEYQHLIEQANNRQLTPDLAIKVRRHEQDSQKIRAELAQIEKQLLDAKRKREDIVGQLSAMMENPASFNIQRMNTISNDIDV